MKQTILSISKKILAIAIIYAVADLMIFEGILYQTLESSIDTSHKNGRDKMLAFLVGFGFAVFGIAIASAGEKSRLLTTKVSTDKSKINKIASLLFGVFFIIIGIFVIFYGLTMN